MYLRRLALLAAVLLPFAAALSAQTQEWKTYSYPADGFRVSLPSEPQNAKRDIESAVGQVELRTYIAMAPNGVALYVGVADYGAKTANTSPDEKLQGAKNGALENTKSRLTREKKITFAGQPGLEMECENDEAYFYARIYLVGGTTLYQTVVVRPSSQSYADTLRFLDSFQFIVRERK